MSLYAVLAELDGTGVPLCYLFTGIDNLDGVFKTADSGASICILKKFLEPLKDAGFSPAFLVEIENKRKSKRSNLFGQLPQYSFVFGTQRER